MSARPTAELATRRSTRASGAGQPGSGSGCMFSPIGIVAANRVEGCTQVSQYWRCREPGTVMRRAVTSAE